MANVALDPRGQTSSLTAPIVRARAFAGSAAEHIFAAKRAQREAGVVAMLDPTCKEAS